MTSKIGGQYRFSKEIVGGWLKCKAITENDNTTVQGSLAKKG